MHAFSRTAGHEDMDDENIRHASHGLILEPGAPPTQTSLNAALKRISLEDDDQVRLALEIDLWKDIVEEREGEACEEDGGGGANHDGDPTGLSPLLHSCNRTTLGRIIGDRIAVQHDNNN